MADDPTPDPVEDEPTAAETEPQDVPDGDEPDDDGTDKPDPKPATPKPAPPKSKQPTQAEFEALQAKLKQVNRESAERRKQLEAMQRERESDQEKAIREAREAERAEILPRVVRAEARVALSAADARPERVAALTRFLDMDKIELDGDNVIGLDDQITQLKVEYPEFFRQPDPDPAPAVPERKPVPRVPVRNQPPTKPQTIGEKIAAAYGTGDD